MPDQRLLPQLEPIHLDLERVAGVLQQALDEVDEPLRSMLRDPLAGGKRLRSALVVLVGRVFAQPPEPFHYLAAAVETLHAATLIHDDLIDDASLRRGRKTLHYVWPARATVLAGDYLLARATRWVAELDSPQVMRAYGQALCKICEGEIRQTLVVKGIHRGRADYFRSIEAKSAALFAAVMEMAGILAGASEREVVALNTYGWELGVAYQIVDDVLDLTEDEGRLGKPIGSDLRNGLVTLPVLHYLEETGDDSPVRAVLAGQEDGVDVQAALLAIRESGAIAASLQEASEHADRARAALEALPDNRARRTLHDLAAVAVQRRH